MDYLFHSNTVSSDRVIYTPSAFARSSLLHLQETGILTACQPHTSRREALSSFLFFTVISGSGQLEYDGQSFILHAGDCVFIDCAKPYSHQTSDDLWTLRWVHFFGSSMVSIYDKYCERGGQPVLHVSDTQPFVGLLEQLHRAAASGDHIRDMRINELLSRLLTLLMEQSWQPAAAKAPARKQDLLLIREYIDGHLTEKITLDELASRFYINKYYLTRTFREHFGVPINVYISQQRVTRAKRLLRYSDLTIEQIAGQCGVHDPNYFSRMFKKTEGVSPAGYRRSWQSSEQND